MIVDSHCHLNMLDLDHFGGMDAVMSACEANGVERMLCIGVDLAHAEEVIGIAAQYPSVYASVGVHPSEVVNVDVDAARLASLAEHPKVIAIGETGLDYYYNDTGLDQQRGAFRLHIALAKKINKPIIVHTRDAREDTIRIMQEEDAKDCGGVMHCFTESVEMAEAALALGFYISISGIVTFKNAKNVQDVACAVPLNRLLIETDSPYLTPVPFRGKPNGPQYVKYVAEKVADLRGVTYEEVATATTKNFHDCFHLKD